MNRFCPTVRLLSLKRDHLHIDLGEKQFCFFAGFYRFKGIICIQNIIEFQNSKAIQIKKQKFLAVLKNTETDLKEVLEKNYRILNLTELQRKIVSCF